MASMLVIVEKEVSGEMFANTHCVITNAAPNAAVVDNDLLLIGANGSFTSTDTDGSAAAEGFLQAVLAFERLMMYPIVTFKNLYVTDGKRNFTSSGAPVANHFFTTALDFAGLSTKQAPAGDLSLSVNPGAITWQVNRNPMGFSNRKGRMFFRSALLEAETRIAGPKLVDWSNTSVRDIAAAWLVTQVGVSNLDDYIKDGASVATVQYAIPHYQRVTAGAIREGELIGATPVQGFTSVGPVLRQVKRGRKEKPPVAPAP